MKQTFASATLKLTAWYLLILMAISISFSAVIYQITSQEIGNRLGIVQSRLQDLPFTFSDSGFDVESLRERQLRETQSSLLVGLFYENLTILLLGGVASYLFAKRTLRPIEEAHAAQTRFTSDASHELRTPLAIMKGELEVALRSTSLTKTEMRELLSSTLEEVNRLSAVSSMLLKLSHDERSALDMHKLDLTSALHQAIASKSVDATRITFNAGDTKRFIFADEHSIVELLVILLDNALRYSPETEEVNARMHSTQTHHIVTITNTGPGIPEKDLARVFDRFYRADSSRTSQTTPGHGLGLSLAKQICDLHEASIHIESTVDVLTTVEVQFKKC